MSGLGVSDSERRVLEVLAAAGGQLAPGDLARTTGLASRTVTKALGGLRVAGLVEGAKSAPRLTLAGRAAGSRAVPAPAGSWDLAVTELLPSWHAAAVRLAADGVVARALGPARAPLPGMVIFGPVASFKSSVAEVVVAMFGLERAVSMVANTSSLSPGAVIGRRERDGSGWRFVPSSYAGQRFVCFDELADAEPGVVREVTRLLYGERDALVEGDRVALEAFTMACFNPPPAGGALPVLTAGTWRRVLRFNTAPVVSAIPAGLGRRLGAFLDVPPAPVAVASLVWPATHLPESLQRVWDGAERVLTERGRAWHDARVFESLALARAARYSSGPEEMGPAAVGVAVDLLCLAETVDGLVEVAHWRADLDSLRAHLGLPGGREALAVIEARDAAVARLAETATQRRASEETVSVELVGARAARSERYQVAVKAISFGLVDVERPEAKALRAQLRDLARRVGEARSFERLAELDALAAPLLERAGSLAGVVEQRKAAAKDAAERTKRDQAERRRAAVEGDRHARQARARAERAAKQQSRDLAGRLKALDALAARSRTRPDENVAARLEAAGCVVGRVDCFTQNRYGVFGKPRVETVRRLVYLDVEGRSYRPEALRAWGSREVLEVIAAARRGLLSAGGGTPGALSRPTPPNGPTVAYTAEALYGLRAFEH